jgi:hypothetical protein
MGIGTLLRYLIGDRTAIQEIAASRRALWVGLLFVVSAGLAREYDGEDLLHEPWHALIPVAASLVSSFILFVLCFAKVMASDPARPPFFSAYRSFLTLFWMTAPLAWLYAIPYERFLSPYDAMRANLLSLGLVAAWRVGLMCRVVTVLMGYSAWASISLVLLFGDGVALLAMGLIPKPMVGFMGGIRHTDTEKLILNTTCCVIQLGLCSMPIWMGGLIAVIGKSKPMWQLPASAYKHASPLKYGLVMLAAFSVGIWAAILPITQTEQLNRRRVERNLKNGRIEEALAEMSAHAPADYPPQWEPPPRIGYGEKSPLIFDVMDVVVEKPPAPWVREIYVEKLDQFLHAYHELYSYPRTYLKRLLPLIQRLPEGPSLIEEHREMIEAALRWADDLTEEEHQIYRSLLKANK